MARARALSPAAQKALAYWGVIELAAETRASTADLWSWIRDAADELGLASPGVTVQGVSELRGRAGQIQEASRQFARLGPNQRVRGATVAHPPWQRDAGSRRAQPKFAVRYRHTVSRGGVLETAWKTSVFLGTLNHTAGQLLRDVELDARHLANKYNTEHVETTDHQVLVI